MRRRAYYQHYVDKRYILDIAIVFLVILHALFYWVAVVLLVYDSLSHNSKNIP